LTGNIRAELYDLQRIATNAFDVRPALAMLAHDESVLIRPQALYNLRMHLSNQPSQLVCKDAQVRYLKHPPCCLFHVDC